MRKIILTLCVVLSSALIFSGCAGPGYGGGFRHQNALAGTAMGAAGGALLGGAVTQDSDGAVVGGLLGGAAGGLMGHSMDRGRNAAPRYPQQGYQQPYYRGGYPRNYGGDGYYREHHHRRHGHDDDD